MPTDIDDDTRRAAIEEQMRMVAHDDPVASHALYHDDAVLEFPQSGERFEGVDNFREWRARIYVTEPWDAPEWRAPGGRRQRPSDPLWAPVLARQGARGSCDATADPISGRAHRVPRLLRTLTSSEVGSAIWVRTQPARGRPDQKRQVPLTDRTSTAIDGESREDPEVAEGS